MLNLVITDLKNGVDSEKAMVSLQFKWRATSIHTSGIDICNQKGTILPYHSLSQISVSAGLSLDRRILRRLALVKYSVTGPIHP